MSQVFDWTSRKWYLPFWAWVCLMLAACGPTPIPVTPTPASTYPSEYRTVHIRRTAGQQYIVLDGEVISGTLVVTEGGAIYEGTIATLGDRETDSCFTVLPDWTCMVAAPFGPITIGQDQLDELHSLVTNVPQEVCIREPEWLCDPWVVLTIAVDDREVSTFCCGIINEDFVKAMGELADFLDRLAPMPQPTPPKDMPPATPSPAADLLPDPSTDPETALRYADLPAGLGRVGWFGTVSVLSAWQGQGTGYL